MRKKVIAKVVTFTPAEWNVAAGILAGAYIRCSTEDATNLDSAIQSMYKAQVITEPEPKKREGSCECGTIPCSCTFKHY